MISRLISLFILITSAQQALAVHTKPFELHDCEKLVLGRKGEIARSKMGSWLAHFNLVELELLRVSVSEENLAEDHAYGNTDDEDRIHTQYKEQDLDQNSPLSKLELKALGILQDTGVSVKDLRLTLKSKSASELVLSAYQGGNQIGETTLAADGLRIGFQNRTQYYQTYWKAEGYSTDVESFFADHGFVLLPSGERFAFVFPLFHTSPTKYFEIMLYTMRECPGREAILMKDVLFPEKGQPSGAKNICLDPLGLKIILPYQDEE